MSPNLELSQPAICSRKRVILSLIVWQVAPSCWRKMSPISSMIRLISYKISIALIYYCVHLRKPKLVQHFVFTFVYSQQLLSYSRKNRVQIFYFLLSHTEQQLARNLVELPLMRLDFMLPKIENFACSDSHSNKNERRLT